MEVRYLALFLTLVVSSSAFTTVSQRNVPAIAHRSILISRTSETLSELDPEAALAEPNVNAVLSVNTESLLDDVCVISEEGTECIEFPPALTAPQRVARALSFYSKVTNMFANATSDVLGLTLIAIFIALISYPQQTYQRCFVQTMLAYFFSWVSNKLHCCCVETVVTGLSNSTQGSTGACRVQSSANEARSWSGGSCGWVDYRSHCSSLERD